ncbi:MAG TPA: hypothetical protein VND65_10225, partial [Candidatus Binatia bacterium]|nr:hypothetical protein [Candidatus Binatia bacterium]
MSEPTSTSLPGRLLPWLAPLLAITAAYLYAFPQPNLFYAAVVLVHAFAGVLAACLLLPFLYRLLHTKRAIAGIGWIFVAAGALFGIALIKIGTARAEWKWLYIHIFLSLIGVAFLAADWLARRRFRPSTIAVPVLTAF